MFGKNKNKQNGITLIALVITIIVLLILAGVTINMVLGDKGIIGQAQHAKQAQENTDAKEKIQLVAQAALTEGLGNIDIEDTTGNEDKKGSLYKAIVKEFGGTSTEATTYDNGKFTGKDGKQYVVSSDGKVGIKKITAEHYGETVEYNGSTDWQIFYDDGTNVYLIAKDYVQLTDRTAEMSAEDYYVWWSPVPSYGKTNANENCAASLADASKWTSFLDKIKAEYVVGAPTLDMFVASWNDKNKIEPTKYPKLYAEYNSTGAFIGTQTGLAAIADDEDEAKGGYDVSLSEATGYNDPLYFIKNTEKAQGYWLASPSAFEFCCVANVDCNGNVSSHYYADAYCGVRPVVCLKSDIQMTQPAVEGGAWTLQ